MPVFIIPTAKSGDQRRDVDLQILRAVAALLVLVDHSLLSVIQSQGLMESEAALAAFAGKLGAIGVGAFFVLSGYIMLETNRSGFASFRAAAEFMVHRLLRIAPIYYIGTIIAFAVLEGLWGKNISGVELATSFLFLPRYTAIENAGFFPVLGVGWTLNMEMFFYLLFAISMCLSPRKGHWLVISAIAAIIALGRMAEMAGVINEQSALYFYAKSMMPLFAAGIVLSAGKERLKAGLAPFAVLFNFHFILIGLIAVSAIYAFSPYDLKWISKPVQWSAVFLVVSAAFWVIGLPAAGRRWLAFLGDASYSIYIFHTIILLHANYLYARLGWSTGVNFVLVALNFLVALAGSVLCYLLVEKPLRSRAELPLRRWISSYLNAGTGYRRSSGPDSEGVA